MNTAQWKGVEEHCPDPHCFQLWGQLGQAEPREFPQHWDSGDGRWDAIWHGRVLALGQ